jgi:hypothetical protein
MIAIIVSRSQCLRDAEYWVKCTCFIDGIAEGSKEAGAKASHSTRKMIIYMTVNGEGCFRCESRLRRSGLDDR